MIETQRKVHPRVKPGQRIFPDIPPLSTEEIAQIEAENEEFGNRCERIFWKVQPELIKEHYDWSIYIEPDSGDYFIDPDPQVCYQKARQKYPNTLLGGMRINETGACGRI
jgi:hypothetical protein